MPYSKDQMINTGSFVPTTNVWDVQEIFALPTSKNEGVGEQLKELLVRLYQNLNLMSLVLNTKNSAYYVTDQFVTSALYYNPNSTNVADLRPGFRTTINTGALGAGVTTVAHNIPWVAGWQFFVVGGSATDSGSLTAVSLPYAGTVGNDNITVVVKANNIVITNNSGLTFDMSAVILEYVQI